MENPIEKWINTDKKLYNLIIEIQSTGKSDSEMAEIAFEKLCELYGIPRMLADVVEDENEEHENPMEELLEKRSLFEEHALIKYLSNEGDDPRGMVLSAAWHLLNGYHVDLWEVAEKEYSVYISKPRHPSTLLIELKIPKICKYCVIIVCLISDQLLGPIQKRHK